MSGSLPTHLAGRPSSRSQLPGYGTYRPGGYVMPQQRASQEPDASYSLGHQDTYIALSPGVPHKFDFKTSRASGHDWKLCRCQTPSSHADAVTFNKPIWAVDREMNRISWIEAATRMLDTAGNKECIGRAEEEATYSLILHAPNADSFLKHNRDIDRAARMGAQIVINPGTTHHAGDGHERRYLSEGDGLQTRPNRPMNNYWHY